MKTFRYVSMFTLTLLVAVLFGNTNSVMAEQATVACPAGYICTKIVPETPTQTLDQSITTNINNDEIWTTVSVVPPCHKFNNNLSVNDFSNNSLGKELLALQKYLISSGYKDVILSGRFDERTKAAVMAYQSKSGLPSTGYVGPLTRAVLNGAVCSNPIKAATTPAASPAPVISEFVGSNDNLLTVGSNNVVYGKNLSNINSAYITSISDPSKKLLNLQYTIKSDTSVVLTAPSTMSSLANGDYYLYLGKPGSVSAPTLVKISQPTLGNSVTAPVSAPRITSISKTNVKYNDTVTLRGANFDGVKADLLFITDARGSISPEILSVSSSRVVFKVPNIPAGTYYVYLASNTGISNKVIMNVSVQAATVVVDNTPKITGISKNVVEYNDIVKLTGVNFSGVRSELLYITDSNGSISPEILSTSPTSVDFKVPNIPAGRYDVYLTANGGTSNKVAMSVSISTQVDTPYISSINPNTGKFGDTVTLNGLNFQGVTSDLLFMDDATGSISPEILSSSATSVVFKVPNVPTGTYSIYLAADKGISNKVNFTVQSNISNISNTRQSATVFEWFMSLLQ